MKGLVRKGGGYAMIVAGTVMLVTPGPGIVTIVGGLVLLSEDVPWAAKAADWLKKRADRVVGSVRVESPAPETGQSTQNPN